MAVATHTLVRELVSHVKWPAMRRGEKLDVRVREHNTEYTDDRIVVSATRFYPDAPMGGDWREVHGVVAPDAIRRYRYTGNTHALIGEFLSVLRQLALMLSAKPPKGWRLFGRAKAPMTRWSRLMTRPLRVTYADKEQIRDSK